MKVNKKSIIGIIFVLLLILVVMLTGFGNKAQENTVVENQVENEEAVEESPIKNGKYEIVVAEQNEELPDEDIYIEINNGDLKLVDGFARLTQVGTFKIENNKLVGKYNEIEYFDQSTNNITKKEISDEIEFEILEGDILKDNIGFGKIFGQTLYQGETYKLSQEYGDTRTWEELYLSFIKNNLKESENALEEEGLLGPFIALIDLNFDDIPELLYYDAEDFINAGDMYTNVYTIEDGNVIYKTKIAIRREERFLKLNNSKIIIHYDENNEPNIDHLKIIENLQGKTISTYNGTHSVWLEDKTGENNQTMTEAEYNQLLIEYFDNIDSEPEVIKSYTLMKDYTDEQKTNIFETAVEEYENR